MNTNKKTRLILIGFFSLMLIPSYHYSFAVKGVFSVETHDVNYDIQNGTVESILVDPDFLELIITMTTQDDGTIEITIPRILLDAKVDSKDDVFFILVDGFETEYVEKEANSIARTLVIPFFEGDSLVEIIGTYPINNDLIETKIAIPDWIKNNAGWWSKNQIPDADFVSGIQYLIKEGIMAIPPTESGKSTNQEIPGWIKNNAGWWSDGLIEDSEFVLGIQYLILNGIMQL